MKIRTGKPAGAQERAEARWLNPSMPLLSDPKATLSQFVLEAGLEEFGELIEEEVTNRKLHI